MLRRSVLAAVVVPTVAAACRLSSPAADSARAAEAHADSVRRFGAAAWTDTEALAYLRLISTTLAADGRTVGMRSRSAAVKAFGQRLATSHRAIGTSVDSAIAGGTAMMAPWVNMDPIRAHEATMRRLAAGGAFDLAYASSVHATLTEASSELDRARPERHAPRVGELMTRARMRMRDQTNTAQQLMKALQPRASP